VLSATPITATEAAWVRLKGADAMREAWQQDGSTCAIPAGLQPSRTEEPKDNECDLKKSVAV